MKIKLISFLVMGLFIGVFLSLYNFASANTLDVEGCLPNQNYSTTTGQRCGCSHNEIYSSTTGLVCARDSQVTGYLTEQGPSVYMWGTHKISNDGFAVCITEPCPSASPSYLVSAGGSSSVLSDLQRYENSKVRIDGKLQWYDLEGGFWGFVATGVTPISTIQIDTSYPPGCSSNIGYSTITGASCGGRECMAPGAVCDPSYSIPYIFEKTLRIGDKGVDVKNLQTFLGLTVDGSFGPKTKARVIEWQRGVGLNPDGIFGPASRRIANTRY